VSDNGDGVSEKRELALAERYCRLSEAGYTLRQALDLAMRDDFDIEYWIRARRALFLRMDDSRGANGYSGASQQHPLARARTPRRTIRGRPRTC